MSGEQTVSVPKRDSMSRINDPVVKYCNKYSSRLHPVQEKLRTLSYEEPMGGMIGSEDSIRVNEFLVKVLNAKKVIDIGVFTGISSLAAALALPEDGKVVALDIDDTVINKLAIPHWKEAGVDHKIEVRIKPAAESLQELLNEGGAGTFDFVFIDADKVNSLIYHELCLKLLRPGGVIAFDNTLWYNQIFDPEDQTERTKATRRLNEKLAIDDRVTVVLLNIGDGYTLAYKK